MLRTGSKGDEVVALQERLKAVGFDPGPVDGAFGPNTEAALRAFQEEAGIAVDGVAGPDTNAKLAEFQAAGHPTRPNSSTRPGGYHRRQGRAGPGPVARRPRRLRPYLPRQCPQADSVDARAGVGGASGRTGEGDPGCAARRCGGRCRCLRRRSCAYSAGIWSSRQALR